MISFIIPKNLNGVILVAELEAANIIVKPNEIGFKSPIQDADGNLWLDIESKDELKAKEIIDNHGK